MTEFQEILSRTLHWEGFGAFTDIPGDHGGATRWGITQKLASKYGVSDVKQLSKDKAEYIYFQEFYKPLPLHDEYVNLFPDIRVKWILFDIAVNSGEARDLTLLQRVLNVPVTHHWDDATYQGANNYTRANGWADQFMAQMCKTRAAFYQSLADNDPENEEKFLNGWLRRAKDNGGAYPSEKLLPLVECVNDPQ